MVEVLEIIISVAFIQTGVTGIKAPIFKHSKKSVTPHYLYTDIQGFYWMESLFLLLVLPASKLVFLKP